MTALGKVLVFFVLVLSIVWNFLVASAFASRTNFKAEAERLSKLYTETAQAANNQRKVYEEKLAAQEAVIAQYRTQVTSVEGQLAAANSQITQYRDKEAANIDDQAKRVAANKLLQADNATLMNQLDLQRGENKRLDADITVATLQEQKAKNDALQAELDKQAAERSRDDTEKKLLDLNEDFNNFKQGGGGPGGLGKTRIPPTDPDFKAAVSAVSGELVTVNQGSNAKLQKNALLDIWRGSKYLGKVSIQTVDPFNATGRFVPLGGAKPVAEDLPKVGDTVGVIPVN